ncbi:hypothetical protein F66182_7778 [Fusarium sp. NRRL 66182]|nr:hypothetical protein F66182_7778 [Fusarium sp. NRRL 66182]
MFTTLFTGPTLLLICLGIILTRAFCNKYAYGYAKIPGPALAAYTDLWRFFNVWGRLPQQTHIALHKRYGPVVRLGPKCISISDPDAIRVIYAIKAGFVKSDFYPVQQPVTRDGTLLQGMFNTTDEKYHAKLRRSVANAFALSTLVQFEPLIDSTIEAFLSQLSKRYADKSGQDGTCDFSSWLQFYAFDVIGELTFSRRLGFVDQGTDVDGIIGDLEWFLGYAAVIGQIPSLDHYLLKNPLRFMLSKLGLTNATTPVARFAMARMASRQNEQEKAADTREDGQAARRDFLSRFLEAQKKDPDFLDDRRVLSLTTANMFAGSDTTAISLRAIFYFLLRNPQVLRRLLDELEQDDGRLFNSKGFVKWSDVHDLPYLSAVIKESLRCHPAVGLPLERIVPPGGVVISGYHFAAGTLVGCSAWTIHRNKEIFGQDAAAFRPERWLEGNEEQKTQMNNFLFSFGAGALFHKFELSLAHPEEEWELHNACFTTIQYQSLHAVPVAVEKDNHYQFCGIKYTSIPGRLKPLIPVNDWNWQTLDRKELEPGPVYVLKSCLDLD